MDMKQMFEQFLALDAGYDVDRLAQVGMEAELSEAPNILICMLALDAGYDVDTLAYDMLGEFE